MMKDTNRQTRKIKPLPENETKKARRADSGEIKVDTVTSNLATDNLSSNQDQLEAQIEADAALEERGNLPANRSQ